MARAAVLAIALACLAASCSLGNAKETVPTTSRDTEAPHTFRERGIVIEIPSDWTAAGFSRTVSPARMAVASYPIQANDVEGDCGGLKAAEALPHDGALVILIDYGTTSSAEFRPRPRHFRLPDGDHSLYECFGESTMFRFRDRGRGFQAFVAFGPDADSARVRDALRLLDSLRVVSAG